MQAVALPEEICWLLEDTEDFLAEGLQNENLSPGVQDQRDHILRGFQQIKSRYCWDFQPQGGDLGQDGSDDNLSGTHGPPLTSEASFWSDYQDEGIEDILRGAQELDNVIKQGYLEKKSKDHSFFGSEWQKRWCVISRGLFLYYANEKSKQPKGTFLIKGYNVRMAPHLRKDSKKESCFELISQDRRSYEFTAFSPAEARDWVDQISFLLKDLSSLTIPLEEEEEEEEEEESFMTPREMVPERKNQEKESDDALTVNEETSEESHQTEGSGVSPVQTDSSSERSDSAGASRSGSDCRETQESGGPPPSSKTGESLSVVMENDEATEATDDPMERD